MEKCHNPQYVISLFRQFLSEQEAINRSGALELILLLIMQQLSVAANDNPQPDNSGVALAYKAQQLIRTQFHLADFYLHTCQSVTLQCGLS